MKKNIFNPVFVPTAYSLRTTLWSVAIVAFFASLMWLYMAFDALELSRKRLVEPVSSVLETPLYRVSLPLGWKCFSRDGNRIAVFKNTEVELPAMVFDAERNSSFAYRALDMNNDICMKIITDDIQSVRLKGLPAILSPLPVGSELLTVMPGVYAMHFIFDIGDFSAEAIIFYVGDVRYVLWGVWPDRDIVSGSEINSYLSHLVEKFEIPELREHIYRPVVDSGKLTAEHNEDIHLKVDREMALWRLFAARADAEPEAALMPAIRHYREALTLLSSIRQEHVELASDDFRRYQTLLEERRKDVDEWFVVLEKAVAMRDWEKARAQAKWIISHATLTGELMDVRRASAILENKIPSNDGSQVR